MNYILNTKDLFRFFNGLNLKSAFAILFFATTFFESAFGQCTLRTSDCSSPINAPAPGGSLNRTVQRNCKQGFNFMGECQQYTITTSAPAYVIITGGFTTTVIASGNTPLTFNTGSYTGTNFIHLYTNSTCGNNTSNITLTLTRIEGCFKCSTSGNSNIPADCSPTSNPSVWARDYTVFNSVENGENYQFSSSNPSDFLLVTDVNNTILAQGTTPVNWTATFNGSVRVHVSTNSSCGSESVGRTITASKTSCCTDFGIDGTITAVTPSTICLGEPITVTASGGSGTVRYWVQSPPGHPTWNIFENQVSNSASNGFTFTPTTPGTYRVHARWLGACGFCWDGGSCPDFPFVDIVVNSPNTTGLTTGDWLWTGAVSTTFEDALNWKIWNGTTFVNAPNIPTTDNNIRIKPTGTCIPRQPTVINLANPSFNQFSPVSANCKDVVIENGATLTMSSNNSHFHVNGNYYNYGTLVPGNARMKFINSGSQSIVSSSSQEIFYEMNVGGASVTTLVNTNVHVTHALRLNGVVATGVSFLYLNNITTGSLASFGGHIFGNFRRDIATNTDLYRFPMGVGTVAGSDRRLLEFLNSNINGPTYLDCRVSNTFKGACPNCDNNLDPAKAINWGQVFNFVHAQGEWTLTPNNTVSSGSYGIRLYTNGFTDLATKDNQFAILKRNDASSNFFDFDSHYLTTTIPSINLSGRLYSGGAGYAEKLGFTTFSKFVIASSEDILPVDFGSMNVTCINQEAHINWHTFSELDNDFFSIERSSDGVVFEDVAKVTGAGTTNQPSVYTYVDDRPLYGLSYYRLSQTDFDGTHKVLKISSFVNDCSESFTDVEVYPNPTTDFTIVKIKVSDQANVSFSLFDNLGREVRQLLNSENLDYGVHEYHIDLNNIAKGVYYLNGKINNDNVTIKLIRQ